MSLLDAAEQLFIARRFPQALSGALAELEVLMGYRAAQSHTDLITVASVRLPASGLIDHACASGLSFFPRFVHNA